MMTRVNELHLVQAWCAAKSFLELWKTSSTSNRMFVLDFTTYSFGYSNTVLVVIIPILNRRINHVKLTRQAGLAALLCVTAAMCLRSAIRINGYAPHHSIIEF